MNPALSLLAGLTFGLVTLLIAYLARRYMKPNADSIAGDQLDYAQRAHLEHRAQAEYHDALASMYARQADRLMGRLPAPSRKVNLWAQHVHQQTQATTEPTP